MCHAVVPNPTLRRFPLSSPCPHSESSTSTYHRASFSEESPVTILLASYTSNGTGNSNSCFTGPDYGSNGIHDVEGKHVLSTVGDRRLTSAPAAINKYHFDFDMI